MFLESNAIIIRQFNMSDASELSKFLSSEYVATWMPGWFKCAEFVDEWLIETIDNYNNDFKEVNCYAVVEKESDAVIGRADCIIHDDDLVEAAIVLSPDYIEKGHLTESYKIFLKYLQDKHKDKQIEVISQAENALETEAIEKIGLRLSEVNQVKEIRTYNHYGA